MISTRGRYALRVLVDLAQNSPEDREGYIPMKDVAARQGMSLKYLEQILPVLSKNKLVEAVHGKGGGYRLAMPPENIRVGDVLRLTEKDLAPVACLAENAEVCDREGICPTLDFWKGLNTVINNYLDGKTLKDLMYREPDTGASLSAVPEPETETETRRTAPASQKRTVPVTLL